MKGLLKLACISSWGLLVLIIILGLTSPLSPTLSLLYIKIVKPLFWTFWGLTLASLFLLIPGQEKQIKERLQKILKMRDDKMAAEINRLQVEERMGGGLSGFLILLLVVPTGLIVMESYLLIETLAYMWLIILFFIAYAVFRNYTKKYKMKEGLVNIHFDFITALGMSITILYILWFSNLFYQPFLASASYIDNTIFASVARKVGDNYTDIRKNELKPGSLRDNTPATFQETLADYTQQLKNGKLTGGTMPYEFQGNKTIHSNFIDQAWELLADGTIPKLEKQKNLETLLDYLSLLVREGYLEEINNNDKEQHKINIIFLKKLNDLMLEHKLETGKWICFLCVIKKHTAIDVSQFGIPLGYKECEPCPDDQP